MTLRAIAAGLIGEFLRSAQTTEELNLREEAILRALDEVYDRRFLEIKTTREMEERHDTVFFGRKKMKLKPCPLCGRKL